MAIDELPLQRTVQQEEVSEVRVVGIGSRVCLRDGSGAEDSFTIERLHGSCQSFMAPLARAVMGRWLGEQVHVWTPAGGRTVTIVRVE